jgi:hypothetical protein
MKACLIGLLLLPGPAVADQIAEPAAALVSRVPEPPVLRVSDLLPQPPRARAPVPPLPPPSQAENTVLIVPDADGVLDESAVADVEVHESLRNPFRVRFHPPLPMRDVRLDIESILVSAGRGRDAVVINGCLYSAGDDFSGLRVSTISGDAVDLRRGNLLLRIPVRDDPVTLRLPRTGGGRAVP